MTLARESSLASLRYVWPIMGVLALSACEQRATGGRSAADTTRAAVPPRGVTDSLVLAAALVALPPPGVAPGDLPDPMSEGAKLLAEFCTACHNLPSPTIHSATDWPSVVRRMWLRMDRLPPQLAVKVPTAQQRQAMLEYLVSNALKVSGATLPEGAGRATFSQVCTRCHALPDPKNHSSADWPTVVMRMEERMTQMKVDRPTTAQTQEIIGYLSQVSTTVRPAPTPTKK